MNASECCRTIGCNCAGTQSVEALNRFMNGGWISFVAFVVIVGVLGFIVLAYSIYKDKKNAKSTLSAPEENKHG